MTIFQKPWPIWRMRSEHMHLFYFGLYALVTSKKIRVANDICIRKAGEHYVKWRIFANQGGHFGNGRNSDWPTIFPIQVLDQNPACQIWCFYPQVKSVLSTFCLVFFLSGRLRQGLLYNTYI